MQISDAKRVSTCFKDVIRFIAENDMLPEMEVWMKRSIWGIGSRQTIYNALNVEKWEDATLGERVILFEAFQMMQEQTIAASSTA